MSFSSGRALVVQAKTFMRPSCNRTPKPNRIYCGLVLQRAPPPRSVPVRADCSCRGGDRRAGASPRSLLRHRLTEAELVITGEQNNPRPEVTPEADALYTETFARERRRRRNSLFLSFGEIVYGGFVVHDSIIAMPTGKLRLGGRRHVIDLPPFLAGPSVVMAILVGLLLLAGLLLGRK